MLLVLLLAASALPAQVYRWVDEDGIVHYSDTPQPGAEEIYLPESNPPPPAAAFESLRRRSPPASSAATAEQQQPFAYETLQFVAPAPEETLWNIAGQLTVRLDVQPELQPGHQVRLYFDGQAQPAGGLTVGLQEVWRGAHNLQAEILDAQGRLMIRSDPIRFYVQQTTILTPN